MSLLRPPVCSLCQGATSQVLHSPPVCRHASVLARMSFDLTELEYSAASLMKSNRTHLAPSFATQEGASKSIWKEEFGGKISRRPAMEDSLDADIYADAYGTDSQDLPFPANDASSALAGFQPGIIISSPPETSPFSGHLETPELQPPPPPASIEAAMTGRGGMDVVSESLQQPLKEKTKLSADASKRISHSRGLVNDAHLRGEDIPVGPRREVEDEFGSISAKKKKLAFVLEEDASLQSGKDDTAKIDKQEKSAFSVKLKNLPAILTNIMGLCKSANADAPDKEQLSVKEQTSNDDEATGCQGIPTDFLEAAKFLCNISNRTSPTADNLDIIEIARRKGLQFPCLDDDSSCSEGFSP